MRLRQLPAFDRRGAKSRASNAAKRRDRSRPKRTHQPDTPQKQLARAVVQQPTIEAELDDVVARRRPSRAEDRRYLICDG